VTALTSNTGSRGPPGRADHLGEVAPSGTSILLSTTSRGRSSSPPYAASSASIASRSDSGSRLGSSVAQSTHVHQHRAALDVPQELQAEALALAGARDQAGHVGDGERVSPACTTPRLGTSVVNG
jgi:hypothetical protein